MKRLIVTADDVGLHRGMTAGAIRAHREGIVTACSVVANGRAFDDAVEQLRQAPTLEVGVHLTLIEERPLTGTTFPRSYRSFLFRYPMMTRGEVEQELRAQIEKVQASGLRVTHLNSHQHLHALPRLFALTVRLAEEYGLRYVRVPADAQIESTGPVRRLSVAALRFLARRARRQVKTDVMMNDATIGITEAGHLRATSITELLSRLSDGLTELVTHPGVDVDAYPHWNYDWSGETEALCDRSVREEIERQGIQLVTPSAGR